MKGEFIKSLQEKFIDILPKKIKALKVSLNYLDTNGDQALETIKNILHNIKNTARSYGYNEIGQIAEEIDHYEGDDLVRALNKFINELESVLGEQEVQKPTILIIDDDDLTTELVKTVLAPEGYRVIVAESSHKAHLKLAENRIDMVIMDIVLPDADGRSLMEDLKSQKDTLGIPVLVLSEETNPSVQKECLEIGAREFIVKPFEINRLVESVQEHFPAERETNEHLFSGTISKNGMIKKFKIEKTRASKNSYYSLAIIKIDNFQSIKYEYGQKVANQILNQYAEWIDQRINIKKYICQWYTDEFVLFLPQCKEEGVGQKIKGLLDFIKDHQSKFEDVKLENTFSAGCRQFDYDSYIEDAYVSVVNIVNEAEKHGGSQILCSHKCGPLPIHQVLLAEEDQIVSSLIIHRLERENYKVEHIKSGPEVLEKLRANPSFSIVILDVKLPEMGGFEIIEKIRNDPRTKNIPVIILTAMGKEHDVIHGLEIGANDYMLKPFSPRELLARVQRFVRQAVPA